MNIVDYIGDIGLADQCAEECSELAQACLKYSRKVRGINPTPKSMDDIIRDLAEEIADVQLCIDQMILLGLIDKEMIESIKHYKTIRWEKRLKEKV